MAFESNDAEEAGDAYHKRSRIFSWKTSTKVHEILALYKADKEEDKESESEAAGRRSSRQQRKR